MRTAARLGRLRQAMAQAEISALFVSQPESRRYLSGYSAVDLPPRDSAGYLLITENHQFLLTDPRTEAEAAVEAPDFVLRRYGGTVRMTDVMKELIAEERSRRVGFEAQHLPYGFWQGLAGALEEVAELVPTLGLVDGLRAIKDDEEIAALRAAIALGDAAFAHVARGLRTGQSERELAWEVEEFLRSHGAEAVAFDPITVAGPNSAIPHARPSSRPIGPSEPVLLDLGAKLDGYCSDMTRTVCLDSPPPELQRLWETVFEAQREAEERARPGMTGIEVDAIARGVIERAGLGDAFLHGLGHGIGLEVHEPPWLTQGRGENVLEVGMAFTVEPGVYVPGMGGVRLEDIVLLHEDGAEVLSRAPKKLRLEEVLLDLDR